MRSVENWNSSNIREKHKKILVYGKREEKVKLKLETKKKR